MDLYSCDFCQKGFKNNGALQMHRSWCTKNPKKQVAGKRSLDSEATKGCKKKLQSKGCKLRVKKNQKVKIAKGKPGRPKGAKRLAKEARAASKVQIEGGNPTVVITGGLPPQKLLPPNATVTSIPPLALPLAPDAIHPRTMSEASQKGLTPQQPWRGLGELPELPLHFRSLLLLGPSGSGKSTLLRCLLKERFPSYKGPLYPSGQWAKGRALIEKFDSPQEGKELLSTVGLSTVPAWLKPYEVLSTGERYRANLALGLAERSKDPRQPFVVDEWTSELDRDLARVISVAFSKRMSKEPGWKQMKQAQASGEVKLEQDLERLERLLSHLGDKELGMKAGEWADEAVNILESMQGLCKAEVTQTESGPFIFASCHQDVLEYLQPQYVVLCEVGQPPWVLENPNEFQLPKLTAQLRGNTEPIRDGLVGSWLPEDPQATMTPFKIAYYQRGFGVTFELSKAGMVPLKDEGGGTYSMRLPRPTGAVDIRFRPQDAFAMEVDVKDKEKTVTLKVQRRRMPFPQHALVLAKDPMQATTALHYNECREEALLASGWYLPPGWGSDGLYSGLRRSKSKVVRAVDFKHTARLEKVDSNQRYLATYVGENNGTLGPKLENISKLLDEPFTGLVTHRLDQFALPDFQLAVICGPSGSGKSTLCRDLFGASPQLTWHDAPVLAHFSSLEVATQLLGAAGLDLATAMRPYHELSGGEQARAHMARVLSLELPVLILDEFTSLVDRPTAHRMARGLQRLLGRRKMGKIVVVSCHSDFVARFLLEPDWLFETHNSRLLTFEHTDRGHKAKSSWQQVASDLEVNLGCLKACMQQPGLEALPNYQQMSQQLAAFQESLEVFQKALEHHDVDEEMPQAPYLTQEPEDFKLAASSMWKLPELVLVLRRALPREWAHFRDFHYKDHSLSNCAITYVATVNGRAAGFTAIVPESYNWIQRSANKGRDGQENLVHWNEVGYPEPFLHQPQRRLFREHRTVVLPEFQGMGLASLICDCVAAGIHDIGFDFTSQTVHPTYGSYRDRSPFWRKLPTSQTEKGALKGNLKFSHVFVGAYRADGTQDPDLSSKLRHRVDLDENRCAVLEV